MDPSSSRYETYCPTNTHSTYVHMAPKTATVSTAISKTATRDQAGSSAMAASRMPQTVAATPIAGTLAGHPEKSFRPVGPRMNLTGFIFQPVIRVVNTSVVGSLAGEVEDALGASLGDARVWVSQDTVLSSTYTDTTNGEYTIMGLAAGSYTASATLVGYDTVSVDIEIVVGNVTSADFQLTLQ